MVVTHKACAIELPKPLYLGVAANACLQVAELEHAIRWGPQRWRSVGGALEKRSVVVTHNFDALVHD